ncbi:hypothetical protein ACFFRR_003892 [Megaselia abdita]
MGPSGAGKSTLLNIISGYSVFNVTGDITINDKPRDIKTFLPQSAYITQDTDLHPLLSVAEAMNFSANLKIGPKMNPAQKKQRVRDILEAIGLYKHRHTRSGNLSGGQRKRLSIALELVSNPPVLILDEPTSGLDSSTSNQCISLLKKLALEGRTIICTIHQPSALAFGMFDFLYTIAEGHCIYSGSTQLVVPFLSEMGLCCPESYNPADYLMEIATHDYGYQNDRLIARMKNGCNTSYRSKGADDLAALMVVEKHMQSGLITPVQSPKLITQLSAEVPRLSQIKEVSTSTIWEGKASGTPKKPNLPNFDPGHLCRREMYASPFHKQLGILLMRTFLILWRDKSLTFTRITIHLIMALLIGFLYFGIGNDGANATNNFKYIFYIIMFTMYTAFALISVKLPLEFPIISREHFNRWYSLRAYYIALTLADFPIQLMCTFFIVVISYCLTGQPLEISRFLLFFLMVLLAGLVAQSVGLVVGASLNVTYGSIFGPFFISPWLIFSGFFIRLDDAPSYIQWMFHGSFLKYSLEGSALAIFGYGRPKMDCDAIYCHFVYPDKFLESIGMRDSSYELAVIVLIIIFMSLRVLAFYIMSFRLRLFK